MNKTDVIKWVVGVGVIPVVRAPSAEEALYVIEAICKYCVTSAVIVTAIFLVSVADVIMRPSVQTQEPQPLE